jgi:hypothetical protein
LTAAVSAFNFFVVIEMLRVGDPFHDVAVVEATSFFANWFWIKLLNVEFWFDNSYSC